MIFYWLFQHVEAIEPRLGFFRTKPIFSGTADKTPFFPYKTGKKCTKLEKNLLSLDFIGHKVPYVANKLL